MLMPKRVKRRKQFRGTMAGKAMRGNTITYGEYGLVALEPCWIKSNQIEAARIALTRYTKRTGQVWIKIFPDKPVTAKPAETRMGSGKGALEYWVAVVKPGRVMFEIAGVPEEAAKEAELNGYKEQFEAAMDDDFNTADAIAAVFDLVKFINTMTDEDSSKEYLENLFDRLVRLTEVLGIIVDKEDEILDSDIEALIAERQAARKEKNFARADEIRDELLAKGIVLKDTREGVQWKRA